MSFREKRSWMTARGTWKDRKGSGKPPLSSTSPPPLGEILATIQLEDLESGKTETDNYARITNTQYLTSYNWINGNSPQIMVPGEPPAWTPLSKPVQLRGDSGLYYRDKNAARYPLYPLEPMIRAIMMDKPEFSLESLDIIGCGSTLGNLLHFARGQGRPFRMLIEVVGNTVFFIRRENSPTETIPDVRGYGHAFPEAYTTWSKSTRGSESHQRLITYDFAGMSCLVRFEADGFLPNMIPDGLRTDPEHTAGTNDIDANDLLSSIEAVTVSTMLPITTATKSTTLEISKGGCYIPQCAVFDLKTRSIKRSNVDTLSEELSRLWIRQVPNFVLAYHTFGNFNDIRVRDVRQELMQWEHAQKPGLLRFATLLQMVVSFARSVEDGKLEVEFEQDSNILNLRSPGGVVGSVLPSSITDKWDLYHDSGA
ncbi:uncharacterized protein BHQ10_002692 [Talaromyces amestolkiae]|uniref:Geranylgeranyl pyrophosphate synthetase n=1 Tax=Talaromyces amestolkiae TaxID=1196081 RepID=A0A364KSZ9_TALAM|nr:uncharacterized protein BHQ10_002692 [Talaromyces amestolkiae]RAO66680.1 hypothetical protein BHQ10_002692 [Talaromyces amestolkiae]